MKHTIKCFSMLLVLIVLAGCKSESTPPGSSETTSQSEGEPSDDALQHLQALTHLKNLNLGPTKVTDAGMEDLEKMNDLPELDLGAKKLQEKLPPQQDYSLTIGLALYRLIQSGNISTVC